MKHHTVRIKLTNFIPCLEFRDIRFQHPTFPMLSMTGFRMTLTLYHVKTFGGHFSYSLGGHLSYAMAPLLPRESVTGVNCLIVRLLSRILVSPVREFIKLGKRIFWRNILTICRNFFRLTETNQIVPRDLAM